MSVQPTILVTGIDGQVGYELLRSLQGLGRIVACNRNVLDLSNPAAIRSFVRETKPSIVINPAAYTAVDKAEADIEGATRLNVDAPRVFAEEAARSGAVLIHYSTDYVFDGTKAGPYVEDDAPAPQNVYGSTKRAGERAIAETGCAHLILRTSWVYGSRGKNFLLTMLALGAQRPELRVVADQFGAPTWANTIAAATAHIVAQGLAAGAPDWWQERAGVYHLTCAGKTSWHGFAEAIFDIALQDKRPRVHPIGSSEYPVPAKRPANSCLSSVKLTETFGLALPLWSDALRLCLQR